MSYTYILYNSHALLGKKLNIFYESINYSTAMRFAGMTDKKDRPD
jgi:hypothetical protein